MTQKSMALTASSMPVVGAMPCTAFFIAGSKVNLAYGEFEGDLYSLLSSQFTRKYLHFKETSNTGQGIVSLKPKTIRKEKSYQICVWRSYSKTVEGSYLNLDDVEGWIQLINLSAGKSFKKILINTSARNHAGRMRNDCFLFIAA